MPLFSTDKSKKGAVSKYRKFKRNNYRGQIDQERIDKVGKELDSLIERFENMGFSYVDAANDMKKRGAETEIVWATKDLKNKMEPEIKKDKRELAALFNTERLGRVMWTMELLDPVVSDVVRNDERWKELENMTNTICGILMTLEGGMRKYEPSEEERNRFHRIIYDSDDDDGIVDPEEQKRRDLEKQRREEKKKRLNMKIEEAKKRAEAEAEEKRRLEEERKAKRDNREDGRVMLELAALIGLGDKEFRDLMEKKMDEGKMVLAREADAKYDAGKGNAKDVIGAGTVKNAKAGGLGKNNEAQDAELSLDGLMEFVNDKGAVKEGLVQDLKKNMGGKVKDLKDMDDKDFRKFFEKEFGAGKIACQRDESDPTLCTDEFAALFGGAGNEKGMTPINLRKSMKGGTSVKDAVAAKNAGPAVKQELIDAHDLIELDDSDFRAFIEQKIENGGIACIQVDEKLKQNKWIQLDQEVIKDKRAAAKMKRDGNEKDWNYMLDKSNKVSDKEFREFIELHMGAGRMVIAEEEEDVDFLCPNEFARMFGSGHDDEKKKKVFDMTNDVAGEIDQYGGGRIVMDDDFKPMKHGAIEKKLEQEVKQEQKAKKIDEMKARKEEVPKAKPKAPAAGNNQKANAMAAKIEAARKAEEEKKANANAKPMVKRNSKIAAKLDAGVKKEGPGGTAGAANSSGKAGVTKVPSAPAAAATRKSNTDMTASATAKPKPKAVTKSAPLKNNTNLNNQCHVERTGSLTNNVNKNKGKVLQSMESRELRTTGRTTFLGKSPKTTPQTNKKAFGGGTTTAALLSPTPKAGKAKAMSGGDKRRVTAELIKTGGLLKQKGCKVERDVTAMTDTTMDSRMTESIMDN